MHIRTWRTHPRLDPMMDRPHQQVHPLEATERLLHLRQPLVVRTLSAAVSRSAGSLVRIT